MAIDFEVLKGAVRDAAAQLGVEDYEIYYSENKSMGVETYQHEIKEFSSSVGGSINIRCIWKGKMGYAQTQLMVSDEMEQLIMRAIENAEVSEKDEEAILYPGGAEYKKVPKYPCEMPSAAFLKEYALDCQEILYKADSMIADGTESGAYAGEHTIKLFNSKGLDLETSAGNSGVYMGAVLDDGKEKQSDYKSEHNCFDTLDKEKLAKEVVEKTKAKFGAGLVKSGKYNIVFDHKQMQSILGTFLSVFFAEDVQKGLSLLKNKVGEKIAAEKLTIIDTPFYEGNTMQIAFDGEGVPTSEKTVIENGILKTLLYNLSSAKKDGVESTGNASRSGSSIGTRVYSFHIVPGTLTKDELLQKAGDGIYITELKGLHAGANSVTGDFSIESAGFKITDGKIGDPIKSFTVAGNFFDLLKEIDEIGSEIEVGGPGYTQIISPDILVCGMSVAGE